MANGGFKKKLPLSAAMRQGGFGTVPPEKPKSGNPFGKSPSAGGNLGLTAAAKAPAAPKAPSFKAGPKLPGLPKMPKIK